MRVVVLALVLSPALALAQTAPAPAATVVAPAAVPQAVAAPQPILPAGLPAAAAPAAAAEPSECVTTTTIRCTGAAAPYAVPHPQPPAIIVPAAAPPPPAAPRPSLLLDPHAALGDGWHLEQSADGTLWRARKHSTDAPGVWGTGLAVWLASYAVAAGVGTNNADGTLIAWWPILGAFFAAGNVDSSSNKALWVVDGFAQAGGFVAFLVGLAVGPEKLEREPLLVTPISLAGGGSGVGLSGHF